MQYELFLVHSFQFCEDLIYNFFFLYIYINIKRILKTGTWSIYKTHLPNCLNNVNV